MTTNGYLQPRRSRLGEVALWTTAAVLMISVHAGAAYYLLQKPEEPTGDNAPPAAIMIELAAEPQAVQTEETVEANDQIEAEEVKSDVMKPVEEPVPEEPKPEPQPVPDPVVEEPQPTPEPPPETATPMPEELPPEPVQEVDPIEQQQMATLENVEVPLPVLRPPPPPVADKVEKKAPEKKRAQKPTVAPQRSEQRNIAKAETTQSDRTAAPRTSSGLFSSSMTPAKWGSRIRSQIVGKKPSSLRANGLMVTVSFRVSESGELSGIRLRSSTGDASLDRDIVAWIARVSPVAAPPPGAERNVTLPISIE